MERVQQLVQQGSQFAQANRWEEAKKNYMTALEHLDSLRKHEPANAKLIENKMRETITMAEHADKCLKQKKQQAVPQEQLFGPTLVADVLATVGDGMFPFVQRLLQQHISDKTRVQNILQQTYNKQGGVDVSMLLGVILSHWDIFQNTLTSFDRTLIHELKWWRNQWAHMQCSWQPPDEYRVVDTALRLMQSALPNQQTTHLNHLAQLRQVVLKRMPVP
eukprot:TRINITY_DN80320_c0_g1_i1.p1 TRINITY_DN80320_c0_g1~~TRINITY_DN80320_c0_g1_i1.p1  ORF type:complete len:228 (+),score=13.47 TRINITY_DN80320_c0_g1_i1:29-685(+)